MESPPRLSETLVDVLSPQDNGVDRRHLQTLAGMIVGLMPASVVRLTAWVPSVPRRAVSAPRLVRRVDRWLEIHRIAVPQ